ncbi:MAG: helicase associated domain-containing protein [Sporichthyaceae bacterium]
MGVRWEPAADRTDAALAACRAFHVAHGHLQPPKTLRIEDGRLLATWLQNQRRARRDGEIDPATQAALDALGFDWDPPVGVRAGELRFSDVLPAIEAFHARHGHANVPPSHRGGVVPDLSRWVGYFRKRHAEGRLPAEQVAALERLGIDWDPYATRRREWLRLCADYRAEHGNLDVPYDYDTACGRKLGAWLSQRRGQRRDGALDAEIAAALEGLGVVWDPPATPRTRREPGPR